jgi:hypothetical protein
MIKKAPPAPDYQAATVTGGLLAGAMISGHPDSIQPSMLAICHLAGSIIAKAKSAVPDDSEIDADAYEKLYRDALQAGLEGKSLMPEAARDESLS